MGRSSNIKFAVFCKKKGEKVVKTLSALIAVLEQMEIDFCINPEAKKMIDSPIENIYDDTQPLSASFDFLITVGGDGTLLQSIPLTLENTIPVIGINAGDLGFLADIQKDEIAIAIDKITKNEYTIEDRSLLQFSDNLRPSSPTVALNEVAVNKTHTSSMLDISLFIDDCFVNKYRADGLIIATPTGSTAYALSAGGAIVSPASNALMIVPLAPHNLTVRPLIIPDTSVIDVKVNGTGTHYACTMDSYSTLMKYEAELCVCKSKKLLKLLKINGHSYYNTIRQKLMWGADKRD